MGITVSGAFGSFTEGFCMFISSFRSFYWVVGKMNLFLWHFSSRDDFFYLYLTECNYPSVLSNIISLIIIDNNKLSSGIAFANITGKFEPYNAHLKQHHWQNKAHSRKIAQPTHTFSNLHMEGYNVLSPALVWWALGENICFPGLTADLWVI